MIPTKMLVYRGPDGGIQTETLPSTRRRKKSTGELFQNGYRVRMGHGQVGEKEDQDSIWYSLGGCVHLISYWGKSCWARRVEGSPVSLELEQLQDLDFGLLIWQTVQSERGGRGWPGNTLVPAFRLR